LFEAIEAISDIGPDAERDGNNVSRKVKTGKEQELRHL
jgi:hypothetical protein